MKFYVVTHYDQDDTEFMYDYTEVSVRHEGAVVAHYGDSYHDKGFEKAEGFIDGVKVMAELAGKTVEVVYLKTTTPV